MQVNRPQHEQDEIDAAIGAMCEAFRGKPSDAMFTGYQLGLSDVPLEAIQRSVMGAMRTCKFMPTIAKLRELCGDSTAADRAVLAFGAVEETVRRVGCYKTVDFDDPIINATIRSHGGWIAVCEKSETEFNKWFRKEFIATYAALTRTGVSPKACEPLMGITDKSNGLLGYEQKPPQRIATGLPAVDKPKIDVDVPKIEFHRIN